MTKCRKILLLIAGLLVATAVVWTVIPSDEPTYHGRKLSYWVTSFGPFSVKVSAKLKDDAREAIQAMGTNAVPYLLRWVQYEPTDKVRKLRDWINAGKKKLGLEINLYDEQQMLGANAVFAFSALQGEAKAQSIRELAYIMTNAVSKTSIYHSSEALGHIGGEAIPIIFGGLTNQNVMIRHYAAMALPHLRSNAIPAIPTLVGFFEDEEVALSGLRALQMLDVDPQIKISAVTNCLLSTNAGVRYWATESLGNGGKDARPIVSLLLRALDDPSVRVRRGAIGALQRIDATVLDKAKKPKS